MTPEEFEERFGFPLPEETEYPPSFNIGPFRNIPAILSDENNHNRMIPMFWQLIPSWSKEFKSPYTAFNSTVESFEKKGYKQTLLKQNRCAIPVNNFFEFLRVEEDKINPKTGRKKKEIKRVPFKFELRNGELMTLGGIYSVWLDAEKKPYYSCSIITLPANKLVKKVHPRMPFILTRETEKIWLDNAVTDFQLLHELITPYPSEAMRCFPVSTAVNNPRNDFPEVLEPVEREVKLNA